MFRYIIILVLLVVASVAPVLAVDTLQVTTPDPVLESWRWTEFDRSSGLAGNVRDIFEDREGNIWFATDNGAQSYDGYHWTTYTMEDGLGDNRVRTVYQTRDGAIWFGTWGGGISRFDSSASSEHAWTTYTTEDGLAGNTMLWRGLVQTRDGTLWAGFWGVGDTTGTRPGISRFDGKTWTTVEGPVDLPRPSIGYIHEASDGSLWFSTWDQNGVLRFDGTGWRQYTTAEGLVKNNVLQIMESRDGALWYARWENA